MTMNSASRKRFARTLFVHPLGKFGISTGLLLSFAVVAFCHANPNKETNLVERKQSASNKNECVDEDKECWKWSRRDLCSHPEYQRFMRKKCRKSCLLCEEKEQCYDDRKACAAWTSEGYCHKETYKKFMAVNCKRSCNLCPDQLLATLSTQESTTQEASEVANYTVQFSEWTAWTQCTRTCGSGSQQRTRECLTGNCSAVQAQPCATQSCQEVANFTTATPVEAHSQPRHFTGNSSNRATHSSHTSYVPNVTSAKDSTNSVLTEEIKPTVVGLLVTQDVTTIDSVLPETSSLKSTRDILTSALTVGSTLSEAGATATGCVDLYKKCERLVAFCATVENVALSCPRTCRVCTGDANADVTAVATTRMPSTLTATTPAAVIERTQSNEVCVDTFGNCAELISECNDRDSMQYLQITCRKTCGFCPNTSSMFGDHSLNKDCADANAHCSDWAQYGFCNSTIYPEMTEYMKESCKKTCRLCKEHSWSQWSGCSATCGGGFQNRTKICTESNCKESVTRELRGCNIHKCPVPSRSCKDSLAKESCLAYRSKDACQTALVASLCAKTCEMCEEAGETLQETLLGDNYYFNASDFKTGNKTCEDQHELCGNWSRRGFCSFTYSMYMREHCPKSCKFCGVWNAWSSWSICNASCGGGVMSRKRTCQTSGCDGDGVERTLCNTFECPVCYDQSPGCYDMQQAEMCKQTFWSFVCKETCGVCPPTSIAGPCYDTREDCKTLRNSGKCANNVVARACPNSCGKCPGYVAEQSGTESQCIDSDANCAVGAVLGLCTASNVAAKCPLSCDLCRPATEGRTGTIPASSILPVVSGCTDTLAVCQDLRSSCNNNSVVTQYCPKTCGVCQETCVDNDGLCPKLAKLNQCQNQIVADDCRLSCGVCSSGTSTPMTNLPEAACEEQLKICGGCASPYMSQHECASVCKKCAPSDGEDACVDRNSQCPRYAQEGKCQKMFIGFLCPFSCEKCDELNRDEPVDVCADQWTKETCDMLESKCDSIVMQVYCKKSCGICKPSECLDKNPTTCGVLKPMGMCSLPEFVRNCPVSCQKCGKDVAKTPKEDLPEELETCKDKRQDCATLFINGQCEHELVKQVCQRSCSTCPSAPPLQGVIDPEAPCTDSSNNCILVKTMGLCKSNKNVRFLCAKSCDNCPRIVTSRKTDLDNSCDGSELMLCRLFSGLCTSIRIMKMCPQTCGLCTASDDQEGMSNNGHSPLPLRPIASKKCYDFFPEECREYSGYCGTSDSYISIMCPETCGSCSGTNPIDTVVATVSTPTVSRVMGAWSAWGMWSACTKTCGTGERSRTRSCEQGTRCFGPSVMSGSCAKDACGRQTEPNQGKCFDRSILCSKWKNRCDSERYHDYMKIQCNYSCGFCTPRAYWSEWTECNSACSSGTQNRTKLCDVEGKCSEEGEGKVELRNCSLMPCNAWSSWSQWSVCSASCGHGNQTRKRFCEADGKVCERQDFEEMPCNTSTPCPEWSKWSPWTECSVSCGNGSTSRSRHCHHESGNSTCFGSAEQTEECKKLPCPEWTAWSMWSDCSASCGDGGKQERLRTCTTSQNCSGSASESRSCAFTKPCGAWSEWSAYSSCSVTCGRGSATRTRTCEGGYQNATDCSGNATQSVQCNWNICPDVGSWSEWEEFGLCSVSCGNGQRTRSRVCIDGVPGQGGCDGLDHSTEKCDLPDCPSGRWTQWSAWSDCSVSCGMGIKFRDRECLEDLSGVSGCFGFREEVERCNNFECPSWTSWLPWSVCSVSCGMNGERTRRRRCFDPQGKAYVSNDECSQSFRAIEKGICNVRKCPKWTNWSTWGKCSVSCGTGWRRRQRRCQNGKFGDVGCINGLEEDKERCNSWNCPELDFEEWGST